MKILFVITKAEIGGAQNFVLNLAKSLKNFGHNVEVAAGVGDYLPEELVKYNIAFHRLNSLKRDYSLFNSLYFVYDLLKLIKKNNYEIVHLNSTNTLIGALSTVFLFRKPKLVFTLHGLSFLDNNYIYHPLVSFFSRQYFKLFLRLIDKAVFVSKNNFDSIKDKIFIKRSSLIYNGLDVNNLTFFSKEDARKYLSEIGGIDLSNSFIIGSAGRLAYPKNYEFLINNFKLFQNKIPNLKVVIIGDGPYREKYIKLISENKIENDFILLGELKDSFKFLKAFDVFTLTSDFEGLSISLLEALFADIPILASNVGGNPEIVENDESQLFTLNDQNEFLNKLIELRKNKDAAISHNNGLKGKFSLAKMTEDYLKIYQELIIAKKS